MQEERFKTWLGERPRAIKTIANRISNCKRAERFEGDMDGHWDADRLGGLMDRLTYSRKDER